MSAALLFLCGCGEAESPEASRRSGLERAAQQTDDRAALRAAATALWGNDPTWELERSISGGPEGARLVLTVTRRTSEASAYDSPQSIQDERARALVRGALRLFRALGSRAPERVSMRVRVRVEDGRPRDFLTLHASRTSLMGVAGATDVDVWDDLATSRLLTPLVAALTYEGDHVLDVEIR